MRARRVFVPVKDPFYGWLLSLSLACLSASCRPTFFFSTHMVMNVICYIYWPRMDRSAKWYKLSRFMWYLKHPSLCRGQRLGTCLGVHHCTPQAALGNMVGCSKSW